MVLDESKMMKLPTAANCEMTPALEETHAKSGALYVRDCSSQAWSMSSMRSSGGGQGSRRSRNSRLEMSNSCGQQASVGSRTRLLPAFGRALKFARRVRTVGAYSVRSDTVRKLDVSSSPNGRTMESASSLAERPVEKASSRRSSEVPMKNCSAGAPVVSAASTEASWRLAPSCSTVRFLPIWYMRALSATTTASSESCGLLPEWCRAWSPTKKTSSMERHWTTALAKVDRCLTM
mmetsp:Transcript_107508/g.346920  ORF Transcript_107508/g.346920 Transcript_107508/m.346920 type:complete len:235 (-) Transcript_107508:410-1114(-)